MYTVVLVVEYDGTDFCGYQIQDNGRTVQGDLEKALSTLYNQEITITGCSRTDSGVHARGHVSSAVVPFYIPADRIPFALNAMLAPDISVRAARYVEDKDGKAFSPRFDTKGKRYVYRVYQSKTRSPLYARFAHHVTYDLDVEAMQEAAQYMVGEHDFASFCATGGSNVTTVRKVLSVNVKAEEILVSAPVLFERGECEVECEGEACAKSASTAGRQIAGRLIEIEVVGEAFLYNMVRIMAGTLVEVGSGKFVPDDVVKIIEAKDRRKAGRTLPACGLTLEEVYY